MNARASYLFGDLPMISRSYTIWALLLTAAAGGLLASTEAEAHGVRGGHSAGRAARAPHFSGGSRAYRAPRISHSATPARVNIAHPGSRANNTQMHTKNTGGLTNNNQGHANKTRTLGSTNGSHSNVGAATTTGTANSATAGGLNTPVSIAGGAFPSTFTYGYGNGARSYRANGYGNGYRNRSYGGGYGYGRSQGNSRAVVARLRSVHASLARIDHDYQGHRARAMHAVSMAIRQLSHRSMIYSGVGFSSGMNNGRNRGIASGWRRVGRARAPAHEPGPIRRSDEPGSAYPAGDQHAARQPGEHQWPCPGQRTCPAGDPRAQCRTLDPLMKGVRSVFDGLERLGNQ